ncbi:hypothetical protein [Streptomyces leeuwenhoekii]|uniref:Sle1_056 protein n=1 Tax=Streptomyces leeuwenhoekii TaxID=1437453 RepID=A0A0F7VMD1_STRLW|nr:hypothetical protein [Streptomyces leeuwenhoekii]CQR59223.1 sle1_056 [Streptomyces leeuwenhoekii]
MTLTAPDPAPQALTPPVVIGIDPSLTGTGIASSDGWVNVIGYKRPRAKDPGITQLPHPERIRAMRKLVLQVIEAFHLPDLVVMELPAVSRSGGGAHERGWFWWQLYSELTRYGVPTALMAPNARALYATGKGNAAKGAVIDAVTLMAAGRDWLGHPITDLPKTHRAALDKATWPTLPGDPR